MPSPGISALASQLIFTYDIGDGTMTSMNLTGDTIVNLSTGMHNGWTSVSPITPTTMEVQLIAAFGSQVLVGSQGYLMMQAIGKGIDDEVAAWVASWDPAPGSNTHLFTVTQGSINTRILAYSPFSSNAVTELATACSTAFNTGFGQEVG